MTFPLKFKFLTFLIFKIKLYTYIVKMEDVIPLSITNDNVFPIKNVIKNDTMFLNVFSGGGICPWLSPVLCAGGSK